MDNGLVGLSRVLDISLIRNHDGFGVGAPAFSMEVVYEVVGSRLALLLLGVYLAIVSGAMRAFFL